ncbi:hypothetical protein CY35_07G011200 [Sphagnum magellanicum]|uniref:Uncharacterized protein n=1 Tax=Sphagnum magellanicum TaxID=128215 RepID=A0ACB8HK94_9BRYO|nr:hypothetical protein CY35_07G011200 [Sphagnum magellanicum]
MWRCCENFSPLKYALSSTLLPCCRFSSHFKAPFSSHCHGKGGGAAAGARNEKLRVFIVAGEPSGDLIGSRLMASLRRLSPRPLQFAGVGGNLMKREGLVSEFPMEDIAVMGVAELLPHLVRIWVRLRQTVTAVMDFRPHVVVTVDAKGFSFRVLRSITDAYRRLGVSRPPLVHYVAPSSWAWKGGENKLKNLADTLDHLLCILPFEAALFKAHGIKATYVGHPVLEDAFTSVAVCTSWCLSPLASVADTQNVLERILHIADGGSKEVKAVLDKILDCNLGQLWFACYREVEHRK